MRHEASITTLALERHHKLAPEVSFVHNFPGVVELGIARGSLGGLTRVLKTIWAIRDREIGSCISRLASSNYT